MSSDDDSDLLRHVRNSSHNDENSMMDFIPLNDDQESEMYDSEPEVPEEYAREPEPPQRSAETQVLCHKIRRLKSLKPTQSLALAKYSLLLFSKLFHK